MINNQNFDSENYKEKLLEAANKAVKLHLKDLGVFSISNTLHKINSVENVDTREIKTKSIKLHDLISGNEIDLFVEGAFRIMEQYDGMSKSANYGFWVKELKVKFNIKTEEFDVIAINEFIALR